MGDEWVPVHLGEVVDLLTGYPFRSEGYIEEVSAPRLLRGDNVAQGVLRWENAKRWPSDAATDLAPYCLREGDVILAMDRPWIEAGLKYASVRRSDLPALLVQRVARLRGSSRCHTGFLKYLIGSQAFTHHVLAVQTGTAVPHISGAQIRSFEFLLPPLLEQRAIAHILGTLDDKIELNRRMNETLEAMARALFKSWFVDFDPVRAKAEGRDPGLPSHIADLFPDSFEDSELGEIPMGWAVSTLADLADLEKGLSYKGKWLAEEGGLPMVNLGCFGSGGAFKRENIKRYRGEYRDRHLVRPGDLVIANTDVTQKRLVLGSPVLIPDQLGEPAVLFTHHTFAVRFKPGAEVWREYLYFTLLQTAFREIAEGFATGTTVLALPRDGLLSFPFCLPPKPLLDVWMRQATVVLRAVGSHQGESRTLAALRDTLLPKLLSGELRVNDAERFLRATTDG